MRNILSSFYLVPQVLVAVWLPKVSQERVHTDCPHRVVVEMHFWLGCSMCIMQVFQNPCILQGDCEHCRGSGIGLSGTHPPRRLCGLGATWRKGHDFPPTSMLVKEGNHDLEQIELLLGCVVTAVCCQRRGGSVSIWLLSSDCMEHLSNMSHGLDCFPEPSA